MSAVVKGIISDTNLSKNARGGTEQMRDRLLKYVRKDLLDKVVIHLSRVRSENYSPIYPNILWVHDLVGDPESNILSNQGWKRFKKLVFVSYWQRDQFILAYDIPYSICTVIQNAIELQYIPTIKSTDKINFIYHTTPHRGLELVYPIFSSLVTEFKNIHLNIYSSFEVYGWKEKDRTYQSLFETLKQHPDITYHGSKPNIDVLTALKTSHIFIYPSIWQETSCISMIEAIKSGCIVVHPDLAALTETAADHTIMYEYTENVQEHCKRSYNILTDLLKNQKRDPNFINNYVINSNPKLKLNSIESFAKKWNTLLEKLLNE